MYLALAVGHLPGCQMAETSLSVPTSKSATCSAVKSPCRILQKVTLSLQSCHFLKLRIKNQRLKSALLRNLCTVLNRFFWRIEYHDTLHVFLTGFRPTRQKAVAPPGIYVSCTSMTFPNVTGGTSWFLMTFRNVTGAKWVKYNDKQHLGRWALQMTFASA